MPTDLQPQAPLPHWRYPVALETLSERQNHRCCWCGVRMIGIMPDSDAPTYEHVTPRSKGGSDDESNLVAACNLCNQLRRTMNWAGFMAWLAACDAIDDAGKELEPADFEHLAPWYQSTFNSDHRRSLERYYGSLTTFRQLDGLPAPSWNLFLAFTKAILDENSSGIWHDPFKKSDGPTSYSHLIATALHQNHRCCFCGATFADGKGPQAVHLLPRALSSLLPTPRLPVAAACSACHGARRSLDAYTFAERRHVELHGAELRDVPFKAARSWLWNYLAQVERERLFAAYLADTEEGSEDIEDPQFFPWLDLVYRNWNEAMSNEFGEEETIESDDETAETSDGDGDEDLAA